MSVLQKHVPAFSGAQYRAIQELDGHLDKIELRLGGLLPTFVDDATRTNTNPVVPPPAAFSVTGIDGKFITFIVNPQTFIPQSVAVRRNQWRKGINVVNTTVLHNLQSATDLNFNDASSLTDYGTSPQLMWTDQDPNVTRFFRLRSSYDGQNWNAWQVFSSPLVCGPIGVQSGLLRTAALTQVNGASTPTTQPLTAATGGPVNNATINIASFVVQYPAPIGPKTYNSGAITPLNDATVYYVYCLDPTYKGGTQTYLASTTNPTITSDDSIVYLGKITTPAHGGGGTGGSGGGNGPCFSGNTLVITRDGVKAIQEVLANSDEVLTQRGWRMVAEVLIHDYKGPMCRISGDEFSTPDHRFWYCRSWERAIVVFRESLVAQFTGKVFNLRVLGNGSDEEQCYTLANGHIVHNVQKV